MSGWKNTDDIGKPQGPGDGFRFLFGPDNQRHVPLVLNFGGGVDSTAMILGFHDRGIVPDRILFADTGSEKPQTYEHVARMDRWCRAHGFPGVTIVSRDSELKTRVSYSSLEDNCLENETLPSLAFGGKSCSLKWKAAPMDRRLLGSKRNGHPGTPEFVAADQRAKAPAVAWRDREADRIAALRATAKGRGKKAREALARRLQRCIERRYLSAWKPVKAIGYDCSPADSRRAVKRNEDADFRYWYPLREWGWKRADCERVIAEHGIPVPDKSACFFCPASQECELRTLADDHPELFKRAIAIEDGAREGKHGLQSEGLWRKTRKGDGRPGSWRLWAEQKGLIAPREVVVMAARCKECRRPDPSGHAAHGMKCPKCWKPIR